MRHDGRTKRNQGCPPVTRIQMIGREDLNQFIASRKMCREIMEQFESTDDERRNQEGNRCAQEKEQQPEQISGVWFLGKKIISQRDQAALYRNEGDGSDESIEHYRQQRARFFVRRFLQQIITFDDVAAGASGKKLVVKQPDEKQSGQSRNTEVNVLHFQ